MADDDRITGLPESVLVLILSFLPVHDAIKTEILSKRWQFLWTYLPSLRFIQDHATNEGFVTFVDKTLPLFNCSKLEKFGVDFDYQPRFAPNVNSWVRFAAGKGVEELCLDFYSVADDFVSHELPQVLYTNASFRSLGFSLCRVTPKGNVAWNSLKKLSIGYVKLSDGVMEKILAGSPVLEVLELYGYGGFNRLDLSNNASVKRLILREFWGRYGPDSERGGPEEDDEDGEHHYDSEEEEEEDDGEHDDSEEEEEDDGEHDDSEEEEEDDGEHNDSGEEEDDGEQDEPEQDEVDGEYAEERLEISAPYLRSLEISCSIPRNCQLRDISSLVDATLDCDGSNDNNERIQDTLRGLVKSLVHVKRLSLGAQATKTLANLRHLSAEHCPHGVQLNEMQVLLTEIQAGRQRQYETMEQFLSSQKLYCEKLEHFISKYTQHFGPPPPQYCSLSIKDNKEKTSACLALLWLAIPFEKHSSLQVPCNGVGNFFPCDYDRNGDNYGIQDTLRGLVKSLVQVKRLPLGGLAAKAAVLLVQT
ncbi:hypothetical protein RHSIM_Rhsim13G0173300 [Rhododendron simsii]|uniref:F-box domain-containing protein n=1 Tax=Rhododendron simsii TaxID=118357 RepID=A0A834L4F3_RHOSS|nr:hypothetical protein RHSIM_Rhsim13G0173300 [Rhododendron simsii]